MNILKYFNAVRREIWPLEFNRAQCLNHYALGYSVKKSAASLVKWAAIKEWVKE